MCRWWPGLTPFNVWQLPLDEWVLFAAQSDAWAKSDQPARG